MPSGAQEHLLPFQTNICCYSTNSEILLNVDESLLCSDFMFHEKNYIFFGCEKRTQAPKMPF